MMGLWPWSTPDTEWMMVSVMLPSVSRTDTARLKPMTMVGAMVPAMPLPNSTQASEGLMRNRMTPMMVTGK